MKKLLLLILLINLFQACTEEIKLESSNKNSFAELEKYAPKPNYSSPENLIKSLWQYKIWSDTVFFYDSTLSIKNFYSDKYFKMNQDIMRKRIDDIKKNGYYIEENQIVKTEKIFDSLVYVYTDELEYPDDRNSDQRKYEIVKSVNEWSINNFYKQCIFCEGSGKAVDNEKDNCEYCNGEGWEMDSAY